MVLFVLVYRALVAEIVSNTNYSYYRNGIYAFDYKSARSTDGLVTFMKE